MVEKALKASSHLLLIAVILNILGCIMPWKTLFIKYNEEEEQKTYFYEDNFLVWGTHIMGPCFYRVNGVTHDMGYEEVWVFYYNLRPTQIILGPEYSYTINGWTGEVIDKKENYPHSLLVNDYFIMLSFPMVILSIITATLSIYEIEKRKPNIKNSLKWSVSAIIFGVTSISLFWIGFENIIKYAEPLLSDNLKWSYGVLLPIFSVILLVIASIILGVTSPINGEESD